MNLEKLVSSNCKSAICSEKPRSKNVGTDAVEDLKKKIPEADKYFDIFGRIGHGTFSTVLLATLKSEKNKTESERRKFAIKHHVPTSHPERIIKELRCMIDIGGFDNVVGINCTFRNNESVAFVMPYMPHERFNDFYSKMDVFEMQSYIKHLLLALKRVHKYRVIHRDVKPSNFLYNRNERKYLLVDFGLAQKLKTKPAEDLKRKMSQSNMNPSSELDKASPSGDGKRFRGSANVDESLQIDALHFPSGIDSPPTKMPLKQQNHNSKHFQLIHSKREQQVEPLLARQVKSAVLGHTLTNRLQDQKSTGAAKQTQETSNRAGTHGDALKRYKANRSKSNLEATSCQCFCYGKPKICNVCLLGKEIHAPRAGTPGYRPPEVLLKYPEQTTAVDIWAVGVIFISILSKVYPFFKAPDDFYALAEMVSIFGDKAIRKTAYHLDRVVTLSQTVKPLDLRKICVRLRNQVILNSDDMIRKYQKLGECDICANCDQYSFNCLCAESRYVTEPVADDYIPREAYDLLKQLLEVNPNKRITAKDALKHPFFSLNLTSFTTISKS